jgi:hypothetical protein
MQTLYSRFDVFRVIEGRPTNYYRCLIGLDISFFTKLFIDVLFFKTVKNCTLPSPSIAEPICKGLL